MFKILLFCEIVGHLLCLKCATDIRGFYVDAANGQVCSVFIPSSCQREDIEFGTVPVSNSRSQRQMNCSYKNDNGDTMCYCNYDECSRKFTDIKEYLTSNMPDNRIPSCIEQLSAEQEQMRAHSGVPAVTAIPPTEEYDQRSSDNSTTAVISTVAAGVLLVILIAGVTLFLGAYINQKKKQEYRKKLAKKEARKKRKLKKSKKVVDRKTIDRFHHNNAYRCY